MDNPITDPAVAQLTSAKVTTLCLFQFCFGYRSALRPSGPQVTEAHTDIISAAVVALAFFLMIFLIVVLTFCFLQALFLFFQNNSSLSSASSDSSPTGAASRSQIVNLFDSLNTHSPLTPVQSLSDPKYSSCTCPICLDDIANCKYAVIRRLPCSHAFHAVCIDRWFLQSRLCQHTARVPPRCPVCNMAVFVPSENTKSDGSLRDQSTGDETPNAVSGMNTSMTVTSDDAVHIPMLS